MMIPILTLQILFIRRKKYCRIVKNSKINRTNILVDGGIIDYNKRVEVLAISIFIKTNILSGKDLKAIPNLKFYSK